MINTLVATALTVSLLLSLPGEIGPVAGQTAQLVPNETILASESLDLGSRSPVPSVNEGFKENILRALDYLEKVDGGKLVIHPDEVFAFHKNILPEFRQNWIITQESGFRVKDGYKYVAGLAGNGVCHLASLMNLVASEAGLEVTAVVNHDFAKIPGIDREFGTSIYFLPGGGSVTERQNLYIRNNQDFTVEFRFNLEGDFLHFSIVSLF